MRFALQRRVQGDVGHVGLSQPAVDRIAEQRDDVGALAFEDYFIAR